MCEFAYERQTESLVLVPFRQFIKIDAEQFECEAHVITKLKVFDHVNDVAFVVFVLFAQMVQDSNLFHRLSIKPFFVSYHLQRNIHLWRDTADDQGLQHIIFYKIIS